MTTRGYKKMHTLAEPFAPRATPRFYHCIEARLYQGKLHECGKPTGGAQRCEEHRYPSGPTGSRFHSVKTIRHTA